MSSPKTQSSEIRPKDYTVVPWEHPKKAAAAHTGAELQPQPNPAERGDAQPQNWSISHNACFHGRSVGFTMRGPLTGNRRIDVALQGTPSEGQALAEAIVEACNNYERAKTELSAERIAHAATESDLVKHAKALAAAAKYWMERAPKSPTLAEFNHLAALAAYEKEQKQ